MCERKKRDKQCVFLFSLLCMYFSGEERMLWCVSLLTNMCVCIFAAIHKNEADDLGF